MIRYDGENVGEVRDYMGSPVLKRPDGSIRYFINHKPNMAWPGDWVGKADTYCPACVLPLQPLQPALIVYPDHGYLADLYHCVNCGKTVIGDVSDHPLSLEQVENAVDRLDRAVFKVKGDSEWKN